MISGARVCVTGGAGMVGHRLVRQLLEAGADVTVIDDMSRGQQIVPGASYRKIDLRLTSDPRFMEDIDIVFNLAASVAGVIYNKANGTSMFRDNMLLQMNPVEMAEQGGVETFVQVSSVCVYSPEHNHPCIEENGFLGDPHGDNAGYAWAKRTGEKAALLSAIPNVMVVRPSNIFGPKDYYDHRAHVIPKLIKAYANDSPVRVFGAGSAQREFIHSDDVASAMIYVAKHGKNRETYNIGTNGETRISMYSLHNMIKEMLNSKSPQEFVDGIEYGEPDRYSDTSKLRGLGWTHCRSLKQGLLLTIEDYLDGQ